MKQDDNKGVQHILIAAGAGILILCGFYLWLDRQSADQLAAPVQVPVEMPPPVARQEAPMETRTVVAPIEPVQEIPLPPEPSRNIIAAPQKIEGSDEVVRRVAKDISPALLDWLTPDQQVRKWVLSIDLMADGEVPKQYRPVAYPLERFAVETVHENNIDQLYLAESNFKRTDLLVQVVTAIDPALVVHYYRAWLPLFEKAYQEQGKPGTFNERFYKALDRLVAAKPMDVKPALVKKGGVIYGFADSRYESASDVEKMFWRMGPENSVKMQKFLAQVRIRLGQP